MVIEVESLNNWVGIVTDFVVLIPIIVTVIILLRKKIYELPFYKKVRSIISIYYLRIIDNKFLIGSILSAVIAVILIISAIISFYSPTNISHTFYSQEIIQTNVGQGRILDYAFDNTTILINKGQLLWWAKGWDDNAKLKSIELDYYAPNETQIRVKTPFQYIGIYLLNGKSTLLLDNISLSYQENSRYGLSIINIGEAPVYLFSIKTEEEQKPILQIGLSFLFGYIFLLLVGSLYEKHKNRNITITPLDELYKEAKLADRIKNLKMELENYYRSLRYLEELNIRKQLSPDFYSKKKEYFMEVKDKLTKEKNDVESEINELKIEDSSFVLESVK